MPNYLLGRDAVAYFSTTLLTGANTAAVLAAATEVGNIMDLSLNVESEFVDSTTRSEAAQGWKSQIAVLKNGEITFEARWKPGDAFFDALKDAWLNGTEICIIALDQDRSVTGTPGPAAQGLAANFSVSFSKTEPLQDIQKVSCTLGISSFPEWYVVP